MAYQSESGGILSGREFQKRDYDTCRLSVPEQFRIFGEGALLLLALDYLFYESLIVLVFLSPLPFFYLMTRRKRAVRDRRRELNYQFKDALVSLSVAVQAGYSLENAVHECARDLEQMYPAGKDIVEEFHYMESQIRVSVPVEELFRDLGRRSRVEDIMNFASVLTVCRHMGGNMAMVIRKCAAMAADKIDTCREIETYIAAKKGEQNIMSLMPAGIILYLKLASPGFLDVMYCSAFGSLMMTICMLIYLAAFWLGKKIVGEAEEGM